MYLNQGILDPTELAEYMFKLTRLEIAEYVSLCSSTLGVIAAITSQQLAYAATPLILTLSLSFVNRYQFQQQIQQTTENTTGELYKSVRLLQQQVQTLPSRIADNHSVNQLVIQVDVLTHKINFIEEKLDEKIKAQLDVTTRHTLLTTKQLQLDTKAIQNITSIFEEKLNALELNLKALSTSRIFTPTETETIERIFNSQLTLLSQDLNNRLKALEGLELDLIYKQVAQLQTNLQLFQDKTTCQIGNVQELLTNLDISSEDLHDYTRQTQQEVIQLATQIDNITKEFNKRISSDIHTIKVPNEAQQLIANIDKKISILDERTNNLEQLQQRLVNLEQPTLKYIKLKDLEDTLRKLKEELSSRFDKAVKVQIAEINDQLSKSRPQYRYELVYDRSGSRKKLIQALQESEKQLVLVCPWLAYYSLDNEVIQLLKKSLEREVKIHIGWGHLNDVDKFGGDLGLIRQKLQSLENGLYTALSSLENLEKEYSTNFHLKLIGTHEKFLVCDSAWGMLTSHNFLCSGDRSAEREIGLITNDIGILQKLVSRYNTAKNLEEQSSKSARRSNRITNYDDIPF